MSQDSPKRFAGLVGLDVGDRTIGVAVTDESGFGVFGLSTVRRQGDRHDFPALAKVLDGREVRRYVVGDPKNMDGTVGPRAEKTRRFAARLREVTGTPVVLWDERLSTFEAEELLRARGVKRDRWKEFVDTIAAEVILRAFVEAGAPDDAEVP